MIELGCWRTHIAGLPPGPELVAALARRPDALAPAPLTDPDQALATAVTARNAELSQRVVTGWANAVLESITARNRVLSWLQAEQYTDLAMLSWHYPGLAEMLPTEIAFALRTSESAAGNAISTARAFATRLPGTLHALQQGLIDVDHAIAVARATGTTTAEVAAQVENDVLPEVTSPGSSTTPEQLRRSAARRVIARDPDGAADRHPTAAKDRLHDQVGRGRRDGRAPKVIAPAQQIAAIWEASTAMADARKTAGDHRPLGARRVDALTDVCTHILGGTIGIIPTDQRVRHHHHAGDTTASDTTPATPPAATHRQRHRRSDTAPATPPPTPPPATTDRRRHRGPRADTDHETEPSTTPDATASDTAPRPTTPRRDHRPTAPTTDVEPSDQHRAATPSTSTDGTSTTEPSTTDHRPRPPGPAAADPTRLPARPQTTHPGRRPLHRPARLQRPLRTHRPRHHHRRPSPPDHRRRHPATTALRPRLRPRPGLRPHPLPTTRHPQTLPHRPRRHLPLTRLPATRRPLRNRPRHRLPTRKTHRRQHQPPHLLDLKCKHHHRAKDGGGFSNTRDPDGTSHWTTPLGRHYTRPPHSVWHPTNPEPTPEPRPGRTRLGRPIPHPTHRRRAGTREHLTGSESGATATTSDDPPPF